MRFCRFPMSGIAICLGLQLLLAQIFLALHVPSDGGSDMQVSPQPAAAQSSRRQHWQRNPLRRGGKPSKPVLSSIIPRVTTVRAPTDHSAHVWMHMPKTAGTAAYQQFMLALHKQQHSVFPSISAHDWNSPGCMGSDIAYGGTHCTVSEMKQCLTNRPHLTQNATDLRFYTILRHPVDRVISEYFWWRTKLPAAWTPGMVAHRRNFTKWILDDTNVAHNRQALFMLMDQPFPTLNDECIHMMGKKLHGWIVQKYGSVERLNQLFLVRTKNTASVGVETTQQAADQLLDGFAYVAVMEHMELSAAAFERASGGVKPLTQAMVRKEHVTRKEFVSDQMRALVLERNQLDMALYERALVRLKRLVEP
jgi:hypothetical protein